MATKYAFLVCTVLFGFVSTENVSFDQCSLSSTEACEVSDVWIDPCAEAAKNEPCKFKRGKPAAISFKFKPKWEKGEGELKTRAYWVNIVDLPFLGMDTDACKYTPCPPVKDGVNQFNYTLDISKNFIAQRYNVKFRIWEDKAQGHECCMIIKMKLV